MALGFSGSNGGISSIYHAVDGASNRDHGVRNSQPLEVSYFVNNVCNLNCKHCYVGYKDTRHANTYEKWTSVFSELIGMGARTFGNVGKEPLLNWDLTRKLLAYFKGQQMTIPKLRYGFVTNGLLLTDSIISELVELAPTYIDISMDGTQESHEKIRGEGTYQKLISNLEKIAKTELADRVFISFTLNKINKNDISGVISTINNMGIKNILVSPYVTLDKEDALYLSDDELAEIIWGIVSGETVDFSRCDHMNIYVKSDYTTSKGLMDKLMQMGVINQDSLFMDEYGVLFNKYTKGTSDVYFNYLPYDNTFSQAIRISHDGYVSGCLEMFYNNYEDRAVGNINRASINQILQDAVCQTAKAIDN